MKFFEYPNFDYHNWDRPRHSVVSGSQKQDELYNQGFSIEKGFLSKKIVTELNEYYDQYHSIEVENGGFFVSIYSKDLDYRKRVHNYLLKTIGGQMNAVFKNFKYTCMNFAVKYPGAEGELFVHQDMAQVDEFKHSQVGVWIPLVDVSLENGTLGILPYSHFTIPPHRSLYHDLPYSKIYRKIHEYVQPLELNAGDMLMFDTRMLHNSFVNKTDLPRRSLATSVVPSEAEFCMTYRNEELPAGKFEVLSLPDDFFLNFADFKSEKVAKPGASTGEIVTINEAFVTEDQFEHFCSEHGLPKTNMDEALTFRPTHSIQEPIVALPAKPKLSLFQRLKKTLID